MKDFIPKPFDTSRFTGGAGLFIQFEDVVTPIYLFAMIKLILTEQSFGIPIHIIKDMSILSIAEWYIKRNNQNPILDLDYDHQLSKDHADELLYKILQDKSIYDYSPPMNIKLFFEVYQYKKMNFPIYIYSQFKDPNIEYYCTKNFASIQLHFIDTTDIIQAIDLLSKDNYTFILSNIHLFKQAVEHLHGKYAHVLIAEDYKYNYKDNCHVMLYDIVKLMIDNPFVATSATSVINPKVLANSLQILNMRGR